MFDLSGLVEPIVKILVWIFDVYKASYQLVLAMEQPHKYHVITAQE